MKMEGSREKETAGGGGGDIYRPWILRRRKRTRKF
jgi:hypothetical protein